MRLIDWLSRLFRASRAVPPMEISQKALDLILEFETGGRRYYELRLKRPTWPGASSGVTIGVGYDVGYRTAAQIRSDWRGHLPPDEIAALLSVRGLKGADAKRALPEIRGRVGPISWESAVDVFKRRTLPEFIGRTKRAFPGSDKLHPDAFGALVSLVFNRGEGMTGSRRLEMRVIRDLVTREDYLGIAQQIRKMRRLWDAKKLKGLHRRRLAEAELVDSALA